MGIRFFCPNGHKLNVKDFQAGLRGVCPFCNAKFVIPTESTRKKGEKTPQALPEEGRLTAAAPFSTSQPSAFPANWPDNPAVTGPAPLPDPFAAQATASQPFVAASAQPVPTATPVAVQSVAQPVVQPVVPTVAPTRPAANDPLSEANVVWYIRPAAGGQFGPASNEVMRAWINEGRVSTDSLVWREGWRDWLLAGDVFPQLQSSVGGAHAAISVPPAAPSVSPAVTAVIPHQSKSTQKLIITAGVLTVVVMVAILLFAIFRNKPAEQPAQPETKAVSTLDSGGSTH